jgi:biopolymer transport protein ExbD
MARLKSKLDVSAEGDMTPMIDMTFQLIAFFMVLINFADDNTNQSIKLPASELAKPPEGPPDDPIVLQMDQYGRTLLTGDFLPLSEVKRRLFTQAQLIKRKKKDPKNSNIIIRADGRVATKAVRELINACQELGFENYTLRAKAEKAKT